MTINANATKIKGTRVWIRGVMFGPGADGADATRYLILWTTGRSPFTQGLANQVQRLVKYG